MLRYLVPRYTELAAHGIHAELSGYLQAAPLSAVGLIQSNHLPLRGVTLPSIRHQPFHWVPCPLPPPAPLDAKYFEVSTESRTLIRRTPWLAALSLPERKMRIVQHILEALSVAPRTRFHPPQSVSLSDLLNDIIAIEDVQHLVSTNHLYDLLHDCPFFEIFTGADGVQSVSLSQEKITRIVERVDIMKAVREAFPRGPTTVVPWSFWDQFAKNGKGNRFAFETSLRIHFGTVSPLSEAMRAEW